MRILQVSPYSAARPGGVQTHVRDLARWLTDAGHPTAIVAPGPDGGGGTPPVTPLGRAVGIGLSGTRFEITWVGGRELAEARRTLDVDHVDVVHLHTPFVPLLPLRLWRAFRRPTVATFHPTLPPQDRLLAAVLGPVARAMRNRLEVAIAVSPSAAELLAPPSAAHPVEIVPPTVDLSAWRAAGRAAGPRDPAAAPRLLFLGRFEARKGLDVLIHAWPEVLRRRAETPPHLIVAGGGELAPMARDFAARWSASVEIVPTPDDATARRLVAEADLLIAPAPWGESFGLVLIAAMAAGTPVVAAANPGYAGVLTGPGAAMLVPPGDAAALAATIADLLADPARLDALRAWGRDHVTRYDVAAVGPRLLDLYRRAVATRARGGSTDDR
ncbi:MAG: glycosyltransferase family 4 protein [Phyllobacteriaceae bacterium]|nr:glycosyltransferase family 4 protein [Phyllobacteriaceae bacterium]